ncbi:MAG: cation diffusion facilitator family transporter [Leadbetterella sp.]|nr:cation diffusion facilitator family transporter [Leadbetterella sp.]
MQSHPHTHNRTKNIKVALFLNIAFTIIELIGGILTNSLAILSDALHDLGDSVVLGTSWFLEKKSNAPKDSKRTFGYARLSLFSALVSALVLVGGSLYILSQVIPRLINPEHVNAQGMIALAVVGIVFNGIGFFRLKKGASMNEKVISWHLLDDVLGWTVILIGSIIILFWDNHIIDPLMTIGFTVFTLWGVSKNIKETFNIFLQGVPAHINQEEMKKSLLTIEEVFDIHDVHIWSLEGETDIFTAHVVVSDEALNEPDELRKKIKYELKKYHIEHSTLEFESKIFCSGVECE